MIYIPTALALVSLGVTEFVIEKDPTNQAEWDQYVNKIAVLSASFQIGSLAY